MKVTDEHVHDDSKVLPKLVEDVKNSKNITVVIGKVFADGAYDSNAVFVCLWQTVVSCHALK